MEKIIIKKDEMTSKERMSAFSKGLEIDRIPCMPHMGESMAPLIGITINEYYHSADKMADLEEFLFNKLGHDSVGINTTLRGVGEALGSKLVFPKNNISYVGEPILKDIKDVDNLDVINPFKDGKIPICLEALAKVVDRLSKVVNVGFNLAGPLSAASAVIGTDKLLRAMIKNPDKLHILLDIVTQCNMKIIEAASNLGVGFSMSDPVSSTSLLSIKQYKEFSMPYEKKCVDKVKEITGGGMGIHICGKSKEIWDLVAETGITSISIDNIEDVKDAKDILGNKICISGNVKPVETIKNGTIEEIMNEAKSCIKKGYGSPKGYILRTGCQIPTGTKIENIEALMNAARIYGRYPIDISKL
ncbi:uroporphyrinogen decarboxylase family protein [Clostridium senegalense]|uniref:uroporphyrinogen decarboxylase family protein n=1 Tax=Clostridium senegalense TaxID=1465809 RepID=UPI001C0FB934|nr:uroporphyrinogen decarboxylase family protein [Clostridium senegalense]MBU5225185.1 uroporphyrinogen decarboxylase family protein [Clostridium senegalense]